MDRGQFGSRFGFMMAAAGAAVGLGNIWGFPTQVASHGGAAFVLAYLILAFCLAFPALMAELLIGRYTRANAIKALPQLTTRPLLKRGGQAVGVAGLLTVAVILSFYAIVAGWMFAYALQPLLVLLGAADGAQWLSQFSLTRNILFTVLFMLATIAIICGGVSGGIERWSKRLMPALVMLLVGLIIYILTLPGAMTGLRAYLLPDFSQLLDAGLLVSALGQAFFSLSLGVGCMLIYGSYMSSKDNIVTLGAWVTVLDVGLAFVAGLLIIPAMYVAQQYGITIFADNGQLLAGDRLIFTVLPALFEHMGSIGIVVALAFFVLMSLASLTSSISLLEVPVAYAVESHGISRIRASIGIGLAITVLSLVIVFNFEALFGLVIALTTRYSQPLLGLLFCFYAGWVWHRNQVLRELQQGFAGARHSLFWKIWPWYIRFVCPIFILLMFFQSFIG